MDSTKTLGLLLPGSNDYVDVEVLNANAKKIDDAVAAKTVTLRVEADKNTTVAVSHASGTYSGTAAQHSEVQADGTSASRSYAEFTLPRGGNASVMFTSGGRCFCITVDLMDGKLEWVVGSHMAEYRSVLAKVPDAHFISNDNFTFADDSGTTQTIKKASFTTLQSGYKADMDHQNELWHAVRCGMLTSAQYQTITGEAYPSTPPTRVE